MYVHGLAALTVINSGRGKFILILLKFLPLSHRVTEFLIHFSVTQRLCG
jgi:hypothetical protein